MMIYECKNCNKEIALSEIDFEGSYFCECGGQEMTFSRTDKNYKPEKKDLTQIMEGVSDHYRD
jgi:hypothetical protein